MQGDPAEVLLMISNPLPFEIRIEKMVCVRVCVCVRVRVCACACVCVCTVLRILLRCEHNFIAQITARFIV